MEVKFYGAEWSREHPTHWLISTQVVPRVAACAELPKRATSRTRYPSRTAEIRRAECGARRPSKQTGYPRRAEAKTEEKRKKVGSSVKNALGVDLAALREAPSVSTTEENVDVPVSEAALRLIHSKKLDWLLRHLIARVALKRNGVLEGGKPLSLIPKYLSKAQLGDPRSTRTSLDYPLWCAEQDVAAQEPDGDGAVEETEDM